MEATVRSFDPGAGSGTVFLDDGTVVGFGGAAFRVCGLRLLRPGQRVRIARSADGALTAVTLSTFPLPPHEGGPGVPPAGGTSDAAASPAGPVTAGLTAA